MKGGPALPGGPLKSKPTRLDTPEFNRVGFFVVPVRLQAADAASAGRLFGDTIMKVLKTVLWTALGLATLSPLGCVRGYERERVVEERQPEPVRREVVVEPRPEPVRREVIVVPPPPPMLEVRVH